MQNLLLEAATKDVEIRIGLDPMRVYKECAEIGKKKSRLTLVV